MKIRNIKKMWGVGTFVLCLIVLGWGLRMRATASGFFAPAEVPSVQPDTLPSVKLLEFNAKQFILAEQEAPSGIPLLRAAPYPTGYVDSTLLRCFTDMDSVNFLPQELYWLSANTAPGDPKHGNSSNLPGHYDAGGINNLYGFSIPLVGDLNGDGKPEIVALSYTYGLHGLSEYLFIFNGQTGAVINRVPLPAKVQYCSTGYHGSPSQIALVDADKDRRGEIIVCFNSASTIGTSSNTDHYRYTKQMASFEVSDSITFDLEERWVTAIPYSAWWDVYGNRKDVKKDVESNDYDFPLPQIVDMDGDGTPEIIVYNKVYSALNGKLLLHFDEMDTGPQMSGKTAYIGSFSLATLDTYNESSIAFPSIYDIDGDGKYDYIAGGKIYYDINLTDSTYKRLNYSATVKDGRTAVADIDGDGTAEIVALTCSVITRHHTFDFTLTVWKPDFSTNTGTTVATRKFKSYCPTAEGFASYLYIGDIDGEVQNGKKLPEISLICGRPFWDSGRDLKNIPVHPNVLVANGGDGLISKDMILSDTDVQGCLVSFTWDNNSGVTEDARLKVSFMLEHQDGSINTGFSLFDFDNDGTAEICYRDERTLRIISAGKSFVKINETDTKYIRMKKTCWSYTGFEYPVIADVDGDGSADIAVLGRSDDGVAHTVGYLLVVSGANRDLAPAPAVWNQFHYHPMKINENLQTPSPNFHPLDDDYKFYKVAGDENPIHTYNSNIMQAVISSSFEANGKEVSKPIVRTPDAKIIDAKITPVSSSNGTLSFKVTNTGDATLPPGTRIRIYQDGELSVTDSIGSKRATGLYRGDTITTYSYNVLINGIYDIIIGGTLGSSGELQPDNGVRECHWPDNHETVALFLPREDLATVPRYGTTVIDVFANDILESPCGGQTLTPGKITTPGGVGVLEGDFGTIRIVNNKIMYTAPGPSSFSGRVVNFSYTLSCEGINRTAQVYVFLLESCTGSFETCAGSSFTVCLKTAPAEGVSFRWYGSDNATYLGQTPPTINNATVDMTYYVKPDFSNATGAWASYRSKNFPTGKLTITVLGASGVIDTMRWSGAVDRDWFNPGNWVQIKNGKSKAATWAPNGNCVDVILGENCPNYPELKDGSVGGMQIVCRNIHLENRAMIAGIHMLTYEEASIDFEPVSTEKDRFVMWSAPLKGMYTGDYHFPKANQLPDWGLIYMNFFQSANPDILGSVASERTYTATFGSMGEPLPLGKAFNIYILPDTEGKRFTFPKTDGSYIGANNASTGALTHSAKFITDGKLDANGMLELPVDDTYPLIQIVNPFAAYLKVSNFLVHNSAKIENAYKIWDGDVDYKIDGDSFIMKNDFITLLSTPGNRYWISDVDDPLLTGTASLIAPFQSFFVMKRSNAGSFDKLVMDAKDMTTTVGPSSGKFTLRSAAEEGVLRITAKQQPYQSATVLLNEAGADPSYDPGEDSRKAFLDGVPVSVYTLTPDREALAINCSGNFDAPVRLGIRLRNTGLPVTLDFSGVEHFGRSVYLIDHEQDDRETDLQKQPSYTFTVRTGANSAAAVTELNDRFSLRFGAPSGTEQVEDDGVKVYAVESRIYIDFPDDALYHITVYNVLGATVYQGKVQGRQAVVSVPPNQLYFVKIQTRNKDHPIRKVMALP